MVDFNKNSRSLIVLLFLIFTLFLLVFNGCYPEAEVEEGVLTAGAYTFTGFSSQIRGYVYLSVYLPPDWVENDSKKYPLIIFLHGNGHSETSFPGAVPAEQLNQWINQGDIPPLVIVTPRGWNHSEPDSMHNWNTASNVTMLTEKKAGELLSYCRDKLRAGVEQGMVSLQGHSRGAGGALYYAFNFSGIFASAVSNSFVADYMLDTLTESATRHQDEIKHSGVLIRLMIGDADEYVIDQGRRGTQTLHQRLENLGITHEFEILPHIDHEFYHIWNYTRPDALKNGLYELKLHARAWRNNGLQQD